MPKINLDEIDWIEKDWRDERAYFLKMKGTGSGSLFFVKIVDENVELSDRGSWVV